MARNHASPCGAPPSRSPLATGLPAVGGQGDNPSVRSELLIQRAPLRVEQRDLVGEAVAAAPFLLEIVAVAGCATF